MESCRASPSVTATKLWEFDRLGSLMMGGATRNSTGKQEGIDDFLHHYDIRDDSLVITGSSVITSERSNPTARSAQAQFSADIGVQCDPVLTTSESGSQTLVSGNAGESDESESRVISQLKTTVSTLERDLVSASGKCTCLISRLSGSLVFEPVFGSLSVEECHRSLDMFVDHNRVSIFLELTSPDPLRSFPLSGAMVKISVRARDMLLYSMNSLMLIIHVRDILRYKKMLFIFRSLGLPVSLLEIPQEATKKVGGNLDNPRRQLVRDS
jgi:hypothetical protein